MAEPAGPIVRRGRLRSNGLPEPRYQRQTPDRIHGGAGNNATDQRRGERQRELNRFGLSNAKFRVRTTPYLITQIHVFFEGNDR